MAEGGVLTFTRPKCPIAAQYNGPGPAPYALPNLVGQPKHDYRSTKEKRPAWIFGIKHGKLTQDSSPGPCHLPNHKTYRDGADGTPHYSLYGRNKDPAAFNVPGAGAYSPEKTGEQGKFTAPRYSFGSRTRARRMDANPAPNAYTMPAMMSRTVQAKKRSAACYSMTGRSKIGSFHEDLKKTPGPGAYNTTNPDIVSDKKPLYSMTSRNPMPGDSTQKPGPGSHSPEKHWPTKKKMPVCSFGIRHSQYTAPLIVDVSD